MALYVTYVPENHRDGRIVVLEPMVVVNSQDYFVFPRFSSKANEISELC